METITKILGNKYTWLVVGCFILAIVLMQSIENYMTTKDTLYPILGFLPSVGIIYWYIIKPNLKNTKK